VIVVFLAKKNIFFKENEFSLSLNSKGTKESKESLLSFVPN